MVPVARKQQNLKSGSTSRKVVRSRMNGLIPFERTIEQTTETMPPIKPQNNNSY